MVPRYLYSLILLPLPFALAAAQDNYKFGPDSLKQPGVPEGKVTQMPAWQSDIFPGTVRDWWIYVPAQYDAKKPACVMIFQDGGWYQDPKNSFRAPTVFDNLIHKNEMPVTIGIFLNPGNVPGSGPGKKSRSNRSFEYDRLSDQYASFLEKEILPEVGKKYNLRQDPAGRAVCGISSGGICAFTAAWERPDLFSKVLSHVGSFTNIRGGDVYPSLIRKTDRKPIRVFLQDGSGDLDNLHGSWPLANQQMAAALKFDEVRLPFRVRRRRPQRQTWRRDPAGIAEVVMARGIETSKQIVDRSRRQSSLGGFAHRIPGGSKMRHPWLSIGVLLSLLLPLRAQDIPLSKILVEKENWRVAAGPLLPVTYLEAFPSGDLAINYGGAHGSLTTKGEVLPGPKVLFVRTVRMASATKGSYFIDDDSKLVSVVDGKRIESPKLAGLKAPTCLTVWPDEGHLVVGEADGAYLWAVRIEKDGSLGRGDRYYSLRTKPNEKMHVTAMTMDAGYLLYACTPLGIQVFDPTGRLSGVIAAPAKETMTAITIGGEKADTLFVAAGDKIYARKIQGKAPYTLKKEK